jgi:hypothetical protein
MRQMLLMVKSKSMCGTELIEAYQSLSAKSAVRPEDENLLTEEGGLSPAAKAASVEQLRLLGRDLVAMESMLLACFYFSSKLYLIDDH